MLKDEIGEESNHLLEEQPVLLPQLGHLNFQLCRVFLLPGPRPCCTLPVLDLLRGTPVRRPELIHAASNELRLVKLTYKLSLILSD